MEELDSLKAVTAELRIARHLRHPLRDLLSIGSPVAVWQTGPSFAAEAIVTQPLLGPPVQAAF